MKKVLILCLIAMIFLITVLVSCGKSPELAIDDVLIPDDELFTSVINISDTIDEDIQIINELSRYSYEKKEQSAYLISAEIITDIYISEIVESLEGLYNEREGLVYVPELSPKQAIILFDFFKEDELYKIAYINEIGTYESILFSISEDGALEFTHIEPRFKLQLIDDNFREYSSDYSFEPIPDGLTDKINQGVFRDYIPTGFRIADGSMGDINNDGITDVLLSLITDNYRVADYSGELPLLILLGQADGSYIVERKIPGILFTGGENFSYPVAGEGYFDIILEYSKGAVGHDININRFIYNPLKNDWLLKSFSYQHDISTIGNPNYPELISPFPDMIDLPISYFDREWFYNNQTSWDYFDEISILKHGQRDTFTLAIKVRNDIDCYEGYIYKSFGNNDSSGRFIQTVRGTIRNNIKPIITSNDEDLTFSVYDNIWKLDEITNTFLPDKRLRPAYDEIVASTVIDEWPGFLEIEELDIDGDGIPELFLNLGTSYSVYTLIDGEAVCLIESENIGYGGTYFSGGFVVYENDSGERFLVDCFWGYGVAAFFVSYDVYRLEEGVLNKIISFKDGIAPEEDWIISWINEYHLAKYDRSLIIIEPAPEVMTRGWEGENLYYFYLINNALVSKDDYYDAASKIPGSKILYEKYRETVLPMLLSLE